MYLNPVIFYVNRYITNTTYVFNEVKGGAVRLISILLIMMPSESFLHKYRISMNIKWYRISISFFLLRIKSMKIKTSQRLQFKNSSQQCYFRLMISNLHQQLNFVKRKKKELKLYFFQVLLLHRNNLETLKGCDRFFPTGLTTKSRILMSKAIYLKLNCFNAF